MTTETTNNELATRKYSVLYAVTRGEYYEIEAVNEGEAKDQAFTDGKFVEGGDTTDVVPCDVEEIAAFTPPSAYEHVREAAEDLLEALTFFRNIASDWRSSARKGYVKQAFAKADAAIAKATG